MTVRRPNLFSMVLFRPYGPSLMAPGAQLWLMTTWVLACLIAGTEAWVIFALMGQAGAELWVRVCAASAVFSAIFLVDASFVLLDVMSSSSTDGVRKRGALGRWTKVSAAVVVRAGIFALTFLITIPIATIALMDDELGAERDQRFRVQLEEVQAGREGELKARIEQARDRLARIRQRWTDEVNAADTDGVSGKLGVGARARKYERDQRILEEEVRRADQDLAEYRVRLGQMSIAQRAEELGVRPPPLTFSARADIMKDISDRPGVQQKELLVKAYLLMAFAAVVLLKLLAPTAVNTYLSEELQEARRRAAEGGYDYLRVLGAKGVAPGTMGPVDFRHWYLTELPKLRERWEAFYTLRESRSSLDAYQRSLDQAVAATGMATEMEERAREKHARAKFDVERLKRKVERHSAVLRGVIRREEELATATKWPTTKAHAEMVEKRAQHEEELVVQQSQLQLSEQHLAARAADLKRAQERRALAEKREAALRTGAAKVEEAYLRAVEASGSVPHAIDEAADNEFTAQPTEHKEEAKAAARPTEEQTAGAVGVQALQAAQRKVPRDPVSAMAVKAAGQQGTAAQTTAAPQQGAQSPAKEALAQPLAEAAPGRAGPAPATGVPAADGEKTLARADAPRATIRPEVASAGGQLPAKAPAAKAPAAGRPSRPSAQRPPPARVVAVRASQPPAAPAPSSARKTSAPAGEEPQPTPRLRLSMPQAETPTKAGAKPSARKRRRAVVQNDDDGDRTPVV